MSFQNTLNSIALSGAFPFKSKRRYSPAGEYNKFGLYSEPFTKETSKSVKTLEILLLFPFELNDEPLPNNIGTLVSDGAIGSNDVVNVMDWIGFHSGVVGYSCVMVMRGSVYVIGSCGGSDAPVCGILLKNGLGTVVFGNNIW